MQIFLSVAIFVFIVSSKIYRLGRKLVGIILCILVWLLAVEAMEGNPMVNWNKTPCWDLNAKFVNNVHEPVWSCLLYSEPIHTEFHYTMRGRNSALWKWRPEFRRMFYKPRTECDNYRRVNWDWGWIHQELCQLIKYRDHLNSQSTTVSFHFWFLLYFHLTSNSRFWQDNSNLYPNLRWCWINSIEASFVKSRIDSKDKIPGT